MTTNVIPFPVRTANPDMDCPDDAIGEARYRVAKIRASLDECDDELLSDVRAGMLSWWERELARLTACWRGPANCNVIELRRA